MTSMKGVRLREDSSRRSFDEARILDHLALCGFARSLRCGEAERAFRECAIALDRWVGLGLPFAVTADGQRCFDPAEVINFLKWAGAQGNDPFWETRFVGNGRALVRSLHDDVQDGSDVPAPARLAPCRFELILEREFDLAFASARDPLVLRMPAPLADDAHGDLHIDCHGPSDVDVDFVAAAGRVDACIDGPRPAKIALTVRSSFTARPSNGDGRVVPLSAQERELYTRASEGWIRVTPRICAIASELARAARDDERALRAFWDFLIDDLALGVLDYERLRGPDALEDVLDYGWFDCQVGSALLVALCRARGIPARVVSGFLLYADSPSYHWWAEAWLAERGWMPVDSVCWDLSLGGRDAAWRDLFFGQVDHRMKCEQLPRIFNRSPGMVLPTAFRILARADGAATQIGLYACDTGTPVYRDRIVVRRSSEDSLTGGSPPAAAGSKVNATPL